MALEYNSMDSHTRYEVWNGTQVIKEPAGLAHEDVLGKLYLVLQLYANRTGLGKVFLSQTAVYAHGGKGDFVCPDLTYISNEKRHYLRANGIFGPPDLTIEIVSPGVKN